MASKKSSKTTKAARPATKKSAQKAPRPAASVASKKIDQRTKELGDWRGKTLEKVRHIIMSADPDIIEEWKWVKPTNPGVPVWSHTGIICTGETYKDKVKLTFARGASLNDPAGLFNSSLDAGTRRAIDIREDEEIDETALKALVREAVTLNASKAPR